MSINAQMCKYKYNVKIKKFQTAQQLFRPSNLYSEFHNWQICDVIGVRISTLPSLWYNGLLKIE